MTRDLADILNALRTPRSCLVVSHHNPDGDAIGSTLAMAHLLQALGKGPVLCVNDDPVPRVLQWLPGAGQMLRTQDVTTPVEADIAIIVDASRRKRLGHAESLLPPGVKTLVLDHHLDLEADGDWAFVDPSYSAVGEIIVELYHAAGLAWTKEAATCAYVSIATDTGGFRYSNTTPRTHRIAAELLESGVEAAAVASRVFDVMSVPKSILLRYVMDRLLFDLDGRVAYSYITEQDLRAAHAQLEDIDGLINFPRNIEGVEVGALFRELEADSTKVSLRSSGRFNCAKFLETWGGGGHAAAAGATVDRPLEAAMHEVLKGVRTWMPAGK